jgi:hypothetical protein
MRLILMDILPEMNWHLQGKNMSNGGKHSLKFMDA